MAGEKPVETFAPLTRQEIIDFFKGVGAKNDCPICSNNGWFVFSAGGDGISDLPFGDKKSLPAIILVCTNCKFLRLHSNNLILNAVRESQKAGEPRGT